MGLLLWFAVLLLLLLKLMLMQLSFMEDMDTELVSVMPVLDMVLDLAMLVLATDMDLLPPLLPDTESPMLPTLLVLSMLLSVRLRPSQRLRLMLVFSMELTAMVLVLVMLDMEDTVLAMAASAMLVLATMARDLLMLNPRLMLVCIMEDMDMVLVLDMLDSDMDIPVLDMLDMVDTDLDMEDTVLDMDVVSTMVKQ